MLLVIVALESFCKFMHTVIIASAKRSIHSVIILIFIITFLKLYDLQHESLQGINILNHCSFRCFNKISTLS